MEREMVERFCKRYSITPRWLRVKTPEEAWRALEDGRAQVMLASGWPEELAENNPKITAGPTYETRRPLLLSHQRRPLDLLRPRICDTAVAVQPAPGLISALKAYGWEQECRAAYAPMGQMRLSPLLEEENEQSTLPYMVADPANFELVAPFYTRIRKADDLEQPIHRRWFWRADEHMLDKRMFAFFRRMQLSGQLADLEDRYHGFFPEAETAGQIAHLRRVLRERLPQYSKSILRAAKRNDLDPLLLVAVIYQESGFDEGAVSHTGVRGLMQLTQETADRFGVADRTDPHQSIHYGARYLKRIWERLEPLGLSHWNRWFLTIASYNQGIGHLFDAMLLAKRMGRDPRSWRNVADALLLLEEQKHYENAAYGYTRGREGVEYVNRVRFYYYVLKGWTLLPGLELDELAPLRLGIDDLGL